MKKSAGKHSGDFGPGTFGCHEALHMTSFVIDVIDRELLQHAAIKQNKKWADLAEKAAGSLAKLYQAIGNQHL